MKRRWKKIISLIVFAGILNMLPGCGHVSEGDFCLLYDPVYTSVNDTDDTLQQIDYLNAIWLEFCHIP